jgi:hypothetical protein
MRAVFCVRSLWICSVLVAVTSLLTSGAWGVCPHKVKYDTNCQAKSSWSPCTGMTAAVCKYNIEHAIKGDNTGDPKKWGCLEKKESNLQCLPGTETDNCWYDCECRQEGSSGPCQENEYMKSWHTATLMEDYDC